MVDLIEIVESLIQALRRLRPVSCRRCRHCNYNYLPSIDQKAAYKIYYCGLTPTLQEVVDPDLPRICRNYEKVDPGEKKAIDGDVLGG